MMNYSYPNQPPNLLDEVKKFFTRKTALSNLILVNIIIWGVIQALRVISFFFNDPGGGLINTMVLQILAIPAALPKLALTPWTIITYNFLHLDFWHILFNMLWLFWFGRIFLEFLKARQLVLVYILGGISGGLIYVLAFNIFPVFSGILPDSFALGASASVMAIVTAISYYVPGYAINLLLIGRIRIGYLALFLFIFDFFMIPSGNAGGHIAHIGGAIFGVVYIMFLKSSKTGYQTSQSSLISRKIMNWFKQFTGTKKPESTPKRPVNDDDYNLQRKNNQRKTDEILEKISKGGYESLTREEKDFLFKTSKKY
jgi:membrane associated rhomboid family serine protease